MLVLLTLLAVSATCVAEGHERTLDPCLSLVGVPTSPEAAALLATAAASPPPPDPAYASAPSDRLAPPPEG